MTTQSSDTSAGYSDGRDKDPFAMPENHLDVVVTPNSVDPGRKASLRTTIVTVISMPLFFLFAFTLCYVSATHAPVPHDMAITLSGPASVTEPLAEAIQKEAEGAFHLTLTADPETARDAVADRTAVGAVIIDGADVTTVIASAGGRVAAPVIQNVGTRVAKRLGGTVSIDDVAVLPDDDQGGTMLFFLLVICTVGGFLSITVISQTMPRAGLRPLVATSVGAAILVPVLGFSMISLFVDFGTTFGTVAAVIGIGMIYTLTVSMIASLFTRLLGQAAVLAIILLLVAMNFPSAGATAPASMLPPFWQLIHDLWSGAGAFESMRSIMYFDGTQLGRWLTQLLIWTGSTFVLTAIVAAFGQRRKQKASAPAETTTERDNTPESAPTQSPTVEPSLQLGTQ